jgi:hypothetical protein
VPEQLKAQLKLLATVKGTNMTDYLAGVIEAEVQRYPEVSRLQEKLQSKEVKEGSE